MKKKEIQGRGKGGVETRGVLRDLSLFVLVGSLAAGHAWSGVEGTRAGYRLSALQADQAELLRERQELRIELATRRSAGRIEADARERLGMVEPAPDRIISLGRKATRTAAAPALQVSPAAALALGTRR